MSESLELSHHSGGRGFVVAFLLTFAAGWLALLLVNVLGNTTQLFPSPLHPAQSERAWKTRRIDALVAGKQPPDVIILGSSRMMQVRPDYVAALAHGRAFNYAVSAANPIDWTAQVGYMLGRGVKPKMIILGVDEFCFGNATSRWQLQSFGHLGLAANQPWPEVVPALGETLSNVAPENTWHSLRELPKKNEDNPLLYLSKSEYVLSDGYMIYRSVEDAKAAGKFDTTAEVRKNAVTFLKKNVDAPDEGMDLTPRRTELFEKLLDRCRAAGIEVRVMLLPLHPEFARIVMNDQGGRLGKIWARVAAYLAQAVPQHGAVYRDFRDCTVFGGDINGFWDGQHMTSENDRRMMNALFGLPPETLARDFPSDEAILKALERGKPAKKRRRETSTP